MPCPYGSRSITPPTKRDNFLSKKPRCCHSIFAMSLARSFLSDPHGMIFIHASCDQPLMNSPITKLSFVILSEVEESNTYCELSVFTFHISDLTFQHIFNFFPNYNLVYIKILYLCNIAVNRLILLTK